MYSGEPGEVDERCAAKACFLAGRRAPELACGAAEAIIDQVSDFGVPDFIEVLSPLTPTEKSSLISDVTIAKGKLILGLRIKYGGSVRTHVLLLFLVRILNYFMGRFLGSGWV